MPIQILIVCSPCLARWPIDPFDRFTLVTLSNYLLISIFRLRLSLRLFGCLVLSKEAFRYPDWTTSICWDKVVLGHIYLLISLLDDLLDNWLLRHLVLWCGHFLTRLALLNHWSIWLLGDRRCISGHRRFRDGSWLSYNNFVGALVLKAILVPRWTILVVPSLFLGWDASNLLTLRRWGDLPLTWLLIFLIRLVMSEHIIVDGYLAWEVVHLHRFLDGGLGHYWSGLVSVVGRCSFESLDVLVHLL